MPQSASEVRAFVQRAVTAKHPIEEVEISGPDGSVTVKVVCPPYSVLSRQLFGEEDASTFPERYLALIRDHMVYATYDEESRAGELLFEGDEGRELHDYMITGANEDWRQISGAADRILKPFLQVATDPNSQGSDSERNNSAPERANVGTTADSGTPDSRPTLSILSVESSSADYSESPESAGASLASKPT